MLDKDIRIRMMNGEVIAPPPDNIPIDRNNINIIESNNHSNVTTTNRVPIVERRVFLGGTCNESTWRSELISKLKVDYYDPVVEDWNEECYLEELRQREICKFCLYVITPKMTGVYSIAEVIDDSNKRPDKTIFCFLEQDMNAYFGKGQIKSLDKVGEMVKLNGGKYFKSLDEIADYINNNM